MSKKALLLIFLSFVAQPSFAGLLDTVGSELVSPVTTDAKYALMGGTLFTAVARSDGAEDGIDQTFQKETVEDKPLGSASHIFDLAGQMIPNAIYAAAFYGIGHFNEDDAAKKRALHMFKATLYSGAVTNILKYTVREKRPDSDHRDSFPSGHSASAFAFAAVIGTEHEWYWAVPAYAMATLVAYSRINDNAHHIYDVFAGATIGITYGLSLHYLYKDEDSPIAKFSVSPFYNGAMVGYKTSF